MICYKKLLYYLAKIKIAIKKLHLATCLTLNLVYLVITSNLN